LTIISLGYYDIIDLTPGTNSDFINSLSKSEYEEIKSSNPPKLPNFNYDEIKELIVKMVKVLDSFVITIDYLSKMSN
jgi:hypothetical protein